MRPPGEHGRRGWRGLVDRVTLWLSPEEERLALDGGQNVQRYLESYHRFRRESSLVDLSTLTSAHRKLGSSLHRGAETQEVIPPAFIYAAARLPEVMPGVEKVILTSSLNYLMDRCGPVEGWREEQASKRRRLAYFDGRVSLAMLVNSHSDLDDIVPSLCAYQIEWNKMHRRLAESRLGPALARGDEQASRVPDELRRALGLTRPDFDTLADLWGDGWDEKIKAVAARKKNISLSMLPMIDADFGRVASEWWEYVLDIFGHLDLPNRPVYMVTSNNHSLVNLLTGFALDHRDAITGWIAEQGGEELRRKLDHLRGEEVQAWLNLLYFGQGKLLSQDPVLADANRRLERETGIRRTGQVAPLLAEAQAMELCQIVPARLDGRLALPRPDALAESRAIILNTDYPLGFAAYHLIKCADRYLKDWRGLFILGKSAAMIGRLGDIMIPTHVRDVHFKRLYMFQNCFSARNLVPYLEESAVFDDQRSLTVHGTFLHSWDAVRHLHLADFTGIEMEAGPCLAAVAEHLGVDLSRESRVLRLPHLPDFSLGILHYTSDTPYNVRASLLSAPLGLTGLESTYSCSLAILQYILDRETGRTAWHGPH